jgi:plasmid stability protein
MATVQVRELPEDTYEVLRRRARRAGQSIQAYMRDQLISLAARPTKQEAVEAIEAILAQTNSVEPSTASILEDIAVERR